MAGDKETINDVIDVILNDGEAGVRDLASVAAFRAADRTASTAGSLGIPASG